MSSSSPSIMLQTPRPPLQTSSSFSRALAAKSTTTSTITKRPRSSSIVSVTEIPENYDDTLDQGALNNVNADWVNYKGTIIPYLIPSFRSVVAGAAVFAGENEVGEMNCRVYIFFSRKTREKRFDRGL